MTKEEALKLALEALEFYYDQHGEESDAKAITAIKEALAKPQQEPVATLWQHGRTGRTRITMPGDITDCDATWFPAADLYTFPPQRKPLTDEEVNKLVDDEDWYNDPHGFVRAIEAAHGIKENT